MKTSTKHFVIFVFLLVVINVFNACKKEVGSDSVSAYNINNGVIGDNVLILRPGSDNGHDSYVEYLERDATHADHNYNLVPEINAVEWTNEGSPVTQRFFIKFSGLSTIPVTAKIKDAELHLYGLSSSISDPQGNSIYPGSPYDIYPDNSCLVQRVTDDWDEHTITWNNQPPATQASEDTIPTSDKQWNYNVKIDVTHMVQRMVANPERNFGFRISLKIEQRYRSMVFGSCEGDSINRPELVVRYK